MWVLLSESFIVGLICLLIGSIIFNLSINKQAIMTEIEKEIEQQRQRE